jgi:hypothetical protein
MRNFRDAKVMAHALRDALKSKSVETTHSDSLELIAKAFGFDNWNVLSAKIVAAERQAGAEQARSSADAPVSQGTLHCSFCGKSQHEVRKLVAGPAVFICDECVELCTDFTDEPIRDEDLAPLMDASNARAMSTEDLAHYVERGRRGVERNQLILQGIQRRLETREGEEPASDDILTLPKLAFLKHKSRNELTALQHKVQSELGRYEDALRLAATALGMSRP